MTLTELAKLLHDWPDCSPSWLTVGQWLAEIESPATEVICEALARLRAPAPDFGRGEDSLILRWYGVSAVVTLRIEDDEARVEIAREAGGGSTEVLKWQ